MLSMNKSLREELRSLRTYLNHIEDRNNQNQLLYDRVRDRHERQISLMHERLIANGHLVKSLQDYCDWWSERWRNMDNERRRLLMTNYTLEARIQALESDLAQLRSRRMVRRQLSLKEERMDDHSD